MESDTDTESSKSGEIGENEAPAVTDDEKARISLRSELSTISFEDLQKMKAELGTTLYNKAVFGVSKTKRKGKSDFKRANKNRPREVSSKRKHQPLENNINAVKKYIPRDPRFDSLSGTFDAKRFEGNFKFINDLQRREKQELEKELQTTTNLERKKQIQLAVQQLNNKIRQREQDDKEKERQRQEKMEFKEKLKSGEKPIFKKKSVKHVESLIEKYEDLKKKNQLQKHIIRRSKKCAAKEQKQSRKSNL